MRPRVLRHRLILAGIGAILAAFTLTTVAAKADPIDVCGSLAANPSVGTVEQLVVGYVNQGLTPGDAGTLIAADVMGNCPEQTPVLRRFVAAYAGAGTERA